MKISEGIYLVGSGQAGFMISNRSDCHVYLLENPEGHILIDAGVGLETDRIVENIKKEGIDPQSIAHLFLTHSHADHSGGTAWFKEKFDVKVYVSSKEAHLLRSSDLIDHLPVDLISLLN